MVLAGTGDPTNEPDSLYGTGILRSADGGNSWTSITGSRDPATGLEQNSFFGEAFAGFAWSTSMPNLVVAAVTTAPGASRVNAGYTQCWRQQRERALLLSERRADVATGADPGWNRIQVLQAPGQQTGVVALAVVWNPIRRIFVAALRNHGFYSSQNGAAWTRLQNQPGTALTWPVPASFSGWSNCPIYSAALGGATGQRRHVCDGMDQNGRTAGCGRISAARRAGVAAAPQPVFGNRSAIANALETSTGVIAGSAHALWLDAIPSGNDTLLFAGTQDLFRCSMAAGCVWRNTTNVNTCATTTQVGPNQHGAAWVANTTTLYFANDRGLWRTGDALNQQQPVCSADDATHFANLNATLSSLVEVTSLAQDPADPNSDAGRGRPRRERRVAAMAHGSYC